MSRRLKSSCWAASVLLGTGLVISLGELCWAAPPASQPAKTPGAARADGPDSQKCGDHPFPRGPREKIFAKLVGGSFKTRATDHFIVFYDADEKTVKDFIQRVERTYESVCRFAEHMNIGLEYPKEKLPVIFCAKYEEFVEKIKKMSDGEAPPEQAGGLYVGGDVNASIFFDALENSQMKQAADKARQAREAAKGAHDAQTKKNKTKEAQWYGNSSLVYQQESNRSAVQHEVTHQLLYNLGIDNRESDSQDPQWLVEGMATIFEPPPGKDGAGFNIVNQRRLHDIRDVIAKASVDDLRAFIAMPSPGRAMLSSDGYARSWAICYYLVKRKAKLLPRYFELIKRRKESGEITPERELADFEKVFGKVDEAFVKDIKTFIRKLPCKPSH